MTRRLAGIGAVREGLNGVQYLADRLAKRIVVEGPAGTGKTQLAKSDDVVRGGMGNDRVWGDGDDDYLNGEFGTDTCRNGETVARCEQ